MDKSWIHHRNRLSSKYADGVHKFIDIARNHVNSDGDTRCPCCKCLNVYYQSLRIVERHIFMNGFSGTYCNWVYHGEEAHEGVVRRTSTVSPVDIDADTSNRVDLNDDILDVLNDVASVIPPTFQSNQDEINLDATATHDETIDNEHEAFGNLFDEARKELYLGCKLSTLTFIVRLM